MDDAVLTRLADQVNEPAATVRRQQKLDEAQGAGCSQRAGGCTAAADGRAGNQKLTELGKKRKLNKYTKDLAAQQERIALLDKRS